MPLADFLIGYGKAIRRLALEAGDFQLIRREIQDEEVTESNRSILFGGTGAFWATHGSAIDQLAGPPRLTAPVSWHAGRELAYVRMRKKNFDPNDWPAVRRTAMRNDALAMRLVRWRWINSQLVAEEFDG
jgi:hypothetical protein